MTVWYERKYTSSRVDNIEIIHFVYLNKHLGVAVHSNFVSSQLGTSDIFY